MSTSASEYKSNPIDLIRPSYNGVNINIKPYLLLIAAAVGFVVAVTVLVLMVIGLFALNHLIGAVAGVLALAGLVVFLIAIGPIPYKLTLAMARNKPTTFGAVINNQFSVAWKLAYTQWLAALVMLAGYVLLIVPGIIFSIWYSLVPYVVLNENLSGWEALKRSKELVQNRFWDTFGANNLISAVSIVSLVPIVGFLAYLAASFLLAPVMAVRYLQLKRLKAHSDGQDIKTHPWNYGVLLISILATILSFLVSYHDAANNSNPSGTDPYYLETK